MGNPIKILLLSLAFTILWVSPAGALFYPIGDLNGDRNVNYKDLWILAEQWLNENCSVAGCEADLNGANGVNMIDFSMLANNWQTQGVTLLISEFMASNGSKLPLREGDLLDENGDSSDWIEIYNPTDKSINLNGWHLLNNDGNEIKEWEFPATELKPGEFLIVFASGKDRAVAGSELHTNFVLGADGDYLVLAKSDGVTIAHEYAPEYPKQLTNISYGLLQDANTFVDSGATVSYHVPTASDAQKNWTTVGFNDSSWDTAKTGLGFVQVQADVIDVTNPGDIVQGVPNDGDWPSNESPPLAIDNNVNTKYLHFKGDFDPGDPPGGAGFQVTPSIGPSIVTGLTFTTANDAAERDPTAFALYGSNVSINGPYTLIATGNIVDFNRASAWPRFTKNTTAITFANNTAHNHYQLLFTAIRNAASSVAMQIAEVEFLGNPAGLAASDIKKQMQNINASLWVRLKFELGQDELDIFDMLSLGVKYEDGFVAYLNGVEVTRRNFSGTPRWDSHADSNRPNDYAKDFENIDISNYIDLLRQGTNMLAIHALNDSFADLNFLILPELVAGSTTRMDVWQYFANPTPGKLNISGAIDLVADTKFSYDRGFYDAPFDVTITTQTEGATIHYTTNGSTPSEVDGNEHTGPIPIRTTTCLRAMAFKPGWISTNVDTQTYIFLDQVIRQPASPAGFPTSWVSTTADYAMDQRVVNDTRYKGLMRDSLLSIPTVSIVTDVNNMFGTSGIYSNSTLAGVTWERPTSIEWIYPDGTTGFHVNAGLRIYGGDPFRGMSLTRKKSFRLLFKRQYGPTKLDFPLFDTQDAATSFDTIVLRAGANDAWNNWTGSGNGPNVQYILDEFIRRTQLALGQVSPHGTFVHLYINGLYWGLYNPVERPMASFCATYYGGDKEEWDALNSGTPTGESSTTTWNAMMSQTSAGLSDNTAYQKIQGNNPDGTKNPAYDDLLDIENYIDWLFSNFWGGTADWPYHNFYVGCRRPPNTTGFKFFDWDAEYVIVIGSGLNSNITGVSDNGARPYVTLRQNDEFRLLFADHAHRHLFNNGPATTEASYARYKELADQVELAIISESARWGDMGYSTPFTLADWQKTRDYILGTYMPQRPAIVLQQLRSAGLYPNVAAPVFYINGSYKHGGQVAKTDQLSMQNPNASGKIYYTKDGNDPRLPTPSQPGTNVTLVTETAAKRVLIPATAVSDAWKGDSEPFDDSLWNDATFVSGKTGGVGYDATETRYDPYISYDVEAKMYTKNDSCYIRIPFTFIGNLSELNFMTLKVRYDDGFVAYLNGTKVAGRNFPDPPAWNFSASGTNPDSAAVQFENIDISSYLGALRSGNNILAIHGLNNAGNRSDFLISVELVAGKGSAIPSPSAIEYTTPITLDKSTVVKARVLSSNTWSALNEARYAVGPVKDKLRITEIMYHPADTGDPNDPNKEFIELKNIGTETLNLNLVRFTEGIHITFPPWELAAGEYVVVVRDLGVFEDQYGTDVNIAGQYSGSLDNAGERIRLEDAVGQMILDFAYKDGWRDITDGDGFSLTIINPADPNINHWGEKDYWRASVYWGGSPGWDDSCIIPNPGDVVINEVLAHSHAGEPDWIELHNTTGKSINISGWFLSDNHSVPKKYQIAEDTVINGYGYKFFWENTDFNSPSPSNPGCIVPFALSENGEEVCLSSAQGSVLTGYQEIQNFGASETGVSFGRYFKASINNIDFVAMSENTPGWANAYPKIGPIVINEIMYNPPSGSDAEFVELRNITGNKVDLFDIEGNTWKFNDEEYGIDYNLPANTSILANGYLLLVKNESVFQSRYPGVPGGVQILQWGNGKLNNGGEKIYISMPGDVDHGERHYIRVDMINYDNKAPWPLEPDGGGASLSRLSPQLYGNDPNNWAAQTPSPGTANP